MTFHLLTIFPRIFDSYFNEGILKKAQDKKIIKIKIHNLRDYVFNKHKTIDDKPFGGGPGMIFKIEPIFNCLKKIKKFTNKNIKQRAVKMFADSFLIKKQTKHNHYNLFQQKKTRIIMLDPKGKILTQKKAQELSRFEEIILIAGRYEGIDSRADNLIDEKISIGNYILSGGELPSLVLIETIVRLLPGALGNSESLKEETASSVLEYPQYTRPSIFSPYPEIKWPVPEILLSGDHKKIKDWKAKNFVSSKFYAS